MRTRERSVWITGVSSGLGASLAGVFLQEGWRVFGSSRRQNNTRTLTRYRTYRAVTMDVRKEASVQRAWETISREVGCVDVLVNNAGVTAFKDILTTTPAEFRDIIDTNLTGIFLTSRVVVRAMRQRRKGLILNILSYAAKTVYTKSGAYGASKSGAEMLMKVMREENRDRGIRVVNVFPGAIETPMWSRKMRSEHGKSMMLPKDVASIIFGLAATSSTAVPEELVIRPERGDLQV